MKLIVTREYDKTMIDDTYRIATSFLQMKSTHLFIASNRWDEIYIELEDTIPDGYLRCLHVICPKITVQLPDTYTEKTMHLLTEIYPDKSGKIRRYFLMHKDVREVLGDCIVQ